MLVNNPMGSRRRRRFYHRAGVVPIPGALPKEDLPDPQLFNFEMEPFEYHESEEFQPTSPRMTDGGKRTVNYITVTSLHSRLLEIVDCMIALAEAEDQEQAKAQGSNQDTDKGADQGVGQGADPGTKSNAQDTDRCVARSSKDMKE